MRRLAFDCDRINICLNIVHLEQLKRITCIVVFQLVENGIAFRKFERVSPIRDWGRIGGIRRKTSITITINVIPIRRRPCHIDDIATIGRSDKEQANFTIRNRIEMLRRAIVRDRRRNRVHRGSFCSVTQCRRFGSRRKSRRRTIRICKRTCSRLDFPPQKALTCGHRNRNT